MMLCIGNRHIRRGKLNPWADGTETPLQRAPTCQDGEKEQRKVKANNIVQGTFVRHKFDDAANLKGLTMGGGVGFFAKGGT
jgi:hypothetical protein